MLRRVVLLVLLVAAVYGVFIEPDRLHVHRETLLLPQWPEEWAGMRIALISDIHAGAPFIGETKLRRIVAETNRRRPDLVLLLGDYVTMGVVGSRPIAPEKLAPILGGLRAPRGTFAVLGNHDGWLGAGRVARAFENAGIRVLRNEGAILRHGRAGAVPLTLYGVADLRTDHAELEPIRALRWPVIAMSHSPDVFPSLPAPVALTVAGHTHGGQVRLPLIGALAVPSIYGRKYAGGLYVERGQRLFVTSGIGTSLLPIRMGAPPEIVILQLNPARGATRLSPTRSPR